MAMSVQERFKLKTRLRDALSGWDHENRDLLFSELDLPLSAHQPLVETLNRASDDELEMLDSMVLAPVAADEAPGDDASDPGPWKNGFVRLFMSHVAVHKAFVSEVSGDLAAAGIHGFVAHESMTVAELWQEQIEHALKSAQAFVAFVHPEFNESAWCQQELGWAVGRGVPVFAIRLGDDPKGFPGRRQWPSMAGKAPGEVSSLILSWVAGLPTHTRTVVQGLMASLRSEGNYQALGKIAKAIVGIDSLTPGEFDLLDQVYWSNGDLRSAYNAKDYLGDFYRQHNRSWPPPRPGGGPLAASRPAVT